MNIKKVEEITGITKQNIRFYEKQELLHPSRNLENDYREYSDDDIRVLKLVKMLRKLQMPIDQIKLVIENEIALEDAILTHIDNLKKEKEQLEAVISFCSSLEGEHPDVHTLDIDSKLNEINRQEQGGHRFGNIVHDFMTVAKAEDTKQFSFLLDTLITTPEEFTAALLKYADENKLDIKITKESMYPEFTINGLEYTANRIYFACFAVITCFAKEPELLDPTDVPSKNREVYKFIRKLVFPALFIFYLIFTMLAGYNSTLNTLLLIVFIAIIVTVCIIRWSKNPDVKSGNKK